MNASTQFAAPCDSCLGSIIRATARRGGSVLLPSFAVKAEVSPLEGFSGHADANGLMAWMRAIAPASRQVVVVHGEPAAADTSHMRIKNELGCAVLVPERLASEEA